ncbi:hypothetical protein CH373_03745 [Leptospira perolatii]|uniref:Haem-binding uptake Tiki superfamily ChaN domain-containing protein n=1 Tax=Leptospira perolatii TaxID=2023191 RepID=A0A2M9ZSY6_9LEPT|nr:ChaN family lipoprotein [Leptospira perolatii]PJZ68780.1 hypothetical protein CH360_14625 [Leptospira perolatii]PJZ75135.1 hypothetical protein CH373_03745 [Leptospira perolatii]
MYKIWVRFCFLLLILFSFGRELTSSDAKSIDINKIEIYESASKKQVGWDALLNAVSNSDALVLGEEHFDEYGHFWKLIAFQRISEKFPLVLSLEALERDQQRVLDEFLQDQISEIGYLSGLKLWTNYNQDYHPLVKAAKERKSLVIAGNCPRRYVNMVSLKGIQSIFAIRSPYLPPRYLSLIHRQPEYETKLIEALSSHGHGVTQENLKNFVDAQHLWDASMSDSIAQAVYMSGRKVFHINGRFHSDEGMGVVYRLKQLGLKVVTFSLFPLEEGKQVGDSEYKLADFVVITQRKPAQE